MDEAIEGQTKRYQKAGESVAYVGSADRMEATPSERAGRVVRRLASRYRRTMPKKMKKVDWIYERKG